MTTDQRDSPTIDLTNQVDKKLNTPITLINDSPKKLPKKALSAYNFFFREKRAELLHVNLQEYNASIQKKRKHQRTHSQVSFQEMAKSISTTWKSLPTHERVKYQQLAAYDRQRYFEEKSVLIDGKQSKVKDASKLASAVYNKDFNAPQEKRDNMDPKMMSLGSPMVGRQPVETTRETNAHVASPYNHTQEVLRQPKVVYLHRSGLIDPNTAPYFYFPQYSNGHSSSIAHLMVASDQVCFPLVDRLEPMSMILCRCDGLQDGRLLPLHQHNFCGYVGSMPHIRSPQWRMTSTTGSARSNSSPGEWMQDMRPTDPLIIDNLCDAVGIRSNAISPLSIDEDVTVDQLLEEIFQQEMIGCS